MDKNECMKLGTNKKSKEETRYSNTKAVAVIHFKYSFLVLTITTVHMILY